VRKKKEGKSMAKKGEARQRITLKCTVCGEENYRTQKNKRNTTERLELNKFCAKCRKVTPHKEEK
jgi:large subunit ribosomal protein L33